MKRTFTIVVLAAVMASFAATAMAGTATPRIDRREARQHMEARAKADGHVTAGERARITHAQNHQSRAIDRRKHNLRTS